VKNKKSIILAISIVLLLVGTFLHQTIFLKAILAKYKSTDHFITLAEDPRIRYENPAKEDAIALKEILDESQKKVESVLKSRFRNPVEAYVCASQDSFNEYVFLSKNVRGAVYWGKLFLSPAAFSQGDSSLGELTTHELTHYFFHTHLGEKAHLENIPLWFREGIAVFVANGGAGYTRDMAVRDLISNKEKEAYLSGSINAWFTSKDPRDALTKNGTANWIYYRVGALFVHYMRDSQPDKFEKLIQLLLSGTEFNAAVELSYGKNIELLLQEFSQYLAAHK
jgi:hypothetical protein